MDAQPVMEIRPLPRTDIAFLRNSPNRPRIFILGNISSDGST
jgi:hypothetical protein